MEIADLQGLLNGSKTETCTFQVTPKEGLKWFCSELSLFAGQQKNPEVTTQQLGNKVKQFFFFFFSITLKWWEGERSINGSKRQTWWISFKNGLLLMPTTGHTMLLLQHSLMQKCEVPDHLQNNLYTIKWNGKEYKARPISAHSPQKANSSTLLWMIFLIHLCWQH